MSKTSFQLSIYKNYPMKKICFLIALCLGINNINYSQQTDDSKSKGIKLKVNDSTSFEKLPSLNDPEHPKWIAVCPKNTDFNNPESFMNHITLGPFDGEFPDKYDFPRNSLHLFSFGDSLTIQTYDPVEHKLLTPVSYKLEQKENTTSSFFIYAFPSKLIEFNAYNVYGNHYGTRIRYRIPMHDSINNVWLVAGLENTVNCAKFKDNNFCLPYSIKHIDYAVKNKICTQFQIFTFGNELVVQTYDQVKDEIIKTEFFNYTIKEDDPLTTLVYFPDFTAELKAYDTYYLDRYQFFSVDCAD